MLFAAPIAAPPRLRPYQHEQIGAIHSARADGERSALIVAATGTGKTVTFCELARQEAKRGGKTVVIVDRDSLLNQTLRKLAAVGVHGSVEQAERWAALDSEAIVATRQTLLSRDRYKRFIGKATLVIYDEAHLSAADGGAKLVRAFADGGAFVLGVTATPKRSDRKSLGALYNIVAHEYTLAQAIADGYLVRPVFASMACDGLRLEQIPVVGGDYDPAALSYVLSLPNAVKVAMGGTMERVGDGKAIVFGVDKAHVRMLHAFAQAVRPGWAEYIVEDTPAAERRAIIDRLANGETRALINCQVATTGFDEPTLTHAAVLRPTKSESLYWQMVGRITRPLPALVDGIDAAAERVAAIDASAKPVGRVLKLCGENETHSLDFELDALAGEPLDDEERGEAERIERERGDGDVLRAAQDAREAVAKRRAAEAEARRLQVSRPTAMVTYTAGVDVVDDPFVRFGVKRPRTSGYYAGIRANTAEYLAKRGVKVDTLTPDEAVALARELRNRRELSTKQAGLMRRYGLDPSQFDSEGASAVIAFLVERKWRASRAEVGGVAKHQTREARRARAMIESEKERAATRPVEVETAEAVDDFAGLW